MAKAKAKSKATGRQEPPDLVLAELKAIKRLLLLFLLKAGTSQPEIGLALDVGQSAVSKMIPARKIKKFRFVGEEEKEGKKKKRKK